MEKNMRTLASGAFLLGLTSIAVTAAHAQDTSKGDWSVDGSVSTVSDYRFRGVSLSSKQPAVQADFAVSHDSGVYAALWGSTIADETDADFETNVSAGYATTIGAFEADISASWYSYPNTRGLDYVEVIAAFSREAGPATVGLEFAYAPPQANIGGVSNRYASMNASVPLAKLPITARGSIGLEDGAFGDRKLDWALGLQADVIGFELGITYIDAARHDDDRLYEPTAVASLKRSF
jgi:uncharacterized protein (TIGR02001 family)